ncbi:MAG: ATP-dependent DNA helicase [Patescibacteria group bacterium]
MNLLDFKKYYQQLNKEQRLAVDSIEGPVMVIAGPGTGKTQILTLRIANILQRTDIPAEAILAVTFTEAGVIAMRKRLTEIIGSQAYEVNINTFHGFAQNVIQTYPESFPRIIGSVNITEADQIRIMEEILEETKGLKILRPFGDRLHYLRDALHAIQTLKREGLSVEDFEKIVEQAAKAYDPEEINTKAERIKLEKQIEKNAELATIYGEYEKRLTKEKLYDFDDMITEVLAALMTNDELRMILQEQYQYVLVDEHQDTNNAQNRILELLMSYHDDPNLFIVGDEKQAIFRFQGASLENFHYFKNKFPEAKLITLTENYRSTQSILDAVATKLRALAGHKEKKIQLLEASDSDSELFTIAKLIKANENSAVLYRDNRDVIPLARMFDKLGIPYHIESDLDILTDPDIRKLLLIFHAIEQFDKKVIYLDLWGVDAFEAEQHLPRIQKQLSLWKTVAYNKSLLELFDTVVQESGLLKSILARPDAVEAIEKLSVLLDQIRRMLEVHPGANLQDFLAQLDRMDRHRLSIKGALAGAHPGKVRLMTAHRSKGLEFDYVYVINAYDGHWGNRKRVEKLKLLIPEQQGADDDRNLFYVALTRARKEITISYAKMSLDQREQIPSQFIGELKQELIEKIEEEKFDKQILFSPSRHTGATDIKNLDFVRELFKKRGFAVTHLNNYIECPWKYFFVNLLRVPKAPEAPQMYGTAVHAALSDILNAETKSKTYLISQFKKHLAVQHLSVHEREDYEERGVEALGKYWDEYHATWTNPVLTEYKIKGVELTSEILLTGNLDKIELLNDHDVIVTDFKTGKPKSRNEIMGKTRTGDASYYRQLVFYNLLLNKHKNGMYKMQAGELDFVEHGRKEQFRITNDECRNLEKEIKRVANEILNLKFWNKKCDEKNCEWCSLRGMMK